MTGSVAAPSCTVRLKSPHPAQLRFLRSAATRRVVKAGRRSGKTTGLAIWGVEEFLKGERVLYAAPTNDQLQRWWHEVSLALQEPITLGLYKKNDTSHLIEVAGTEQRLRAKTAWDPDSLRGDYATRLILDEFSLMHESTWTEVGAPMLLDRDGVCTFAFTPPSLRMLYMSKARDTHHASTLFKTAAADTTGRWAAFHFTSHHNPHISARALADITMDMSPIAYRNEILAEETDDVPGALWTQLTLDRTRIQASALPHLTRIVVALDPAGTSRETADEMGIIAAGRDVQGHGYTLRDGSQRGTPADCARIAIQLYDTLEADVLIGEANNGGEWIETVIRFVAAEMHRRGERATATVHYKMVHASRNKQTRAEPVATECQQGRIHHVGYFPELEAEQCHWVPGLPSPSRMDAEVWAYTELLLTEEKRAGVWGR